MIELVSGRKYYGRYGTGWVVLFNGQPHHETTRADAMKLIALLPKEGDKTRPDLYSLAQGRIYGPESYTNKARLKAC